MPVIQGEAWASGGGIPIAYIASPLDGNCTDRKVVIRGI